MHTPMQTMRFGLTLPGQQWVKTFLQQQQYYAIQSGRRVAPFSTPEIFSTVWSESERKRSKK